METQIRKWTEEGKKNFESKNYGRAEQYFRKVLKSGARYADLLNMLGIIYHAEGRFNDAIESFRKALEINPGYIEATLNLAVLLNDLGDYRQAKSLYQRIQKGRQGRGGINQVLKAKLANQHAAIADTYAGIGRLGEAIEEYRKALALCPTFKDIQTKLGVCYRDDNRKGLALKTLTQTVRNHPHYSPARVQLGLTYYSQGKTSRAVQEWREVLKADKNNTAAQMYLRISENHKKKG